MSKILICTLMALGLGACSSPAKKKTAPVIRVTKKRPPKPKVHKQAKQAKQAKHAKHEHGHDHPHDASDHHHHDHPHPHLEGPNGHHHPY